MSRKAVERREKLIQFVNEKNEVTMIELVERYGVSEATIRRDLAELDSFGKITRTFGGARSAARMDPELPIDARMHAATPEKTDIGRLAASLIEPGSSVFISSGTTAFQAARFLAEKEHLTVITNSLPVINLMSRRESIELIALGGLLRHAEQSFIGRVTEQAIHDLRTEHVIMGVRAIHPEHGLTNEYQAETRIDQLLFEISNDMIVVADSSKFNKVAPAFLAPMDRVNTVVTDGEIDPTVVAQFRSAGVKILFGPIE